jgi:hypothetical protein
MGNNLRRRLETKDKITKKLFSNLIDLLIKKGCKYKKELGYWDTSKEAIVKDSLDKAKSTIFNKGGSIHLIFRNMHFCLEFYKNTFYLNIDIAYLREKETRNKLNSLTNIIKKIMKVESISEIIGYGDDWIPQIKCLNCGKIDVILDKQKMPVCRNCGVILASCEFKDYSKKRNLLENIKQTVRSLLSK